MSDIEVGEWIRTIDGKIIKFGKNCVNKECKYKNECIRHMNKYEFNENKNYWFMSSCEKFEKE